MFSIYSQVIRLLDYPQVYDPSAEMWLTCSVDMLSGLIAKTDSETDMLGFFAECDRIDEAIQSLGFEV